MRKLLFLILCIGACVGVRAQVTGVVLDGDGQPLAGANIYWAGTTVGVAADFEGQFSIMPLKQSALSNQPSAMRNKLVFSFVGCHSDTIEVKDRTPLTVVLVDESILDEVLITARKRGVVEDRLSAFDAEHIGVEELCRAACCNLSEAFETNASVDVAYSDAATGAKQIRLLGLSGTYVQLLQENTPAVRGLAQNFGLEYIPGPWMGGIQVSKGTSSVINGYEATSGQINVDLLKPQTQNPLSINLMFNSELMAEANIMGGWQIPLKEHEHYHEHGEHCHHESLYTSVLAHYGQNFMAMDENHDSFADMPLTRNANLANRWFYKHGDYTFQAFVRGLYDKRLAGQIGHHADTLSNPYKIDLNTWRVEGFMKNGYVYDDESGSSVAVIAAVSYHDLNNRYGLRNWKANQLNAYLNAIWQGNFEGGGLIDNDHRLSAGASLNVDRYRESLSILTQSLDRLEITPGIFAEYSYNYAEMLSLVAGVRFDYSTRYGFFVTPRANIRYSPFEWWTLRVSAGLGYRSPNLIADNAGLLVSSREWKRWDWFADKQSTLQVTPLQQERALNTGISTTFYIPLGNKQLQLGMEYYYTRFFGGQILDMDRDKHAIYIYDINAIGYNQRLQSFAHSAQIEASIEVLRGWTWTAAFRYTDVEQTTFNATTNQYELRPKALTNRFKGVITTSYQTPLKKWQFDVTAQFNGVGRMPDGFTAYGDMLGGYGTAKPITWYPQLMAQITKYFRTCSLYLGAENMTNFRQNPSVVGYEDPWGPNFDASMVCGPTTGWKVYLGFRYDLDKKE